MRIARVVHGIHNSHDFPDGEFVTDRDNVYNVTYPTYMTNCSVCHSDDNIVPAAGVSALAAANAMPVTGEGCFTCHGSMASWDFAGPPDLTFHLTLPDPETADCQVCHKDGGVAAGKVVVADFHNGATTGRGGIIFDGVDTSVAEGAKFDWQITGVVDDGTDLAISWTASYDGVGVDPCNATAGAGTPVFHGDGEGNLSMLRNYAQGDDFILGQSTSAPGQALSVNVTTDNTTCAERRRNDHHPGGRRRCRARYRGPARQATRCQRSRSRRHHGSSCRDADLRVARRIGRRPAHDASRCR